MNFVTAAKSIGVFSKKPVNNLLWLLSLLVACSSGVEQDRRTETMKFTAPGGVPFIRAVDASSIQATVEWRRDSEDGLSTQNMTRVGATGQWESGPIAVISGASYEIFVTWRATGVDGVSVIYARQDYSFSGTSSNAELNLSEQPHQFDLFNDDGGEGNNYQELLAGTSPTQVSVSSPQINPIAPADPTLAEADPTPAEVDPTPAEVEPTPAEADPTPTEADPTPTEVEPTPAEVDPEPAENSTDTGSTTSDGTETSGTDTPTGNGATTDGSESENTTDNPVPLAGTDDENTDGSSTDGNTVNNQSRAAVLISRILPEQAPNINGLDVVLSSQGSLTGEWANAVQADEAGAGLWIDSLMVVNEGNEDTAVDGEELHRWAAMHDGVNLYIVVLSDDVGLRSSDSTQIWRDDALELFINGNNSTSSEWDNDDFHYQIALQQMDSNLANNETSYRVTTGPGPISPHFTLQFATGSGTGPTSIRQANFEQDVYEISIPIAAAGITIGTPFGLELQIDDDDNGGERDTKWGWAHPSRENDTNIDFTFEDPSVMGTLTLEE